MADLARGQLVDLLARFPDNVEARRELRDLLLEGGRQEEAAEQQEALAALEGGVPDPMGDLEGLEVPVSSEEGEDVPVFALELEALPPSDHLRIDLDDTADPTRPFDAIGAVGGEDDDWTSAGREIRSAVNGQVGRDDYETRYDLGIAYREMGLLDEAVAELQLASRGPSRLVESSSLLAACFLDKGLPQLAIKWLERGLAAPGLVPQQALSLRYDLAGAREAQGEADRALEIYVELYGENAGFRDVAEKLRRLSESRRPRGVSRPDPR
jgi:tetratricopeptide (TPR) repeat protein